VTCQVLVVARVAGQRDQLAVARQVEAFAAVDGNCRGTGNDLGEMGPSRGDVISVIRLAVVSGSLVGSRRSEVALWML
jgi:hypothetical protein